MLNNYVKNIGTSKTIVFNNNKNHIDEIKWDADYDGDIANLSLTTNKDGIHKHYNMSINNDDLVEMLNYPSVNIPIDKRLEIDFINPNYELQPFVTDTKFINNSSTVPMSILSPKSGEEFIVPVTIDNKLIPRKHKTHVTYKVYKKHKSSSHRKSKSSHRKSKSSRRKSKSSSHRKRSKGSIHSLNL